MTCRDYKQSYFIFVAHTSFIPSLSHLEHPFSFPIEDRGCAKILLSYACEEILMVVE